VRALLAEKQGIFSIFKEFYVIFMEKVSSYTMKYTLSMGFVSKDKPFNLTRNTGYTHKKFMDIQKKIQKVQDFSTISHIFPLDG
jgi:hypothetical protein